MGRMARTNGGVSVHAVKRVIQQYSSSLRKKEVRKIIREEKKDIKNGQFVFSGQAIRKLRVTIPPKKILVGIVSGGTVVTVEDKFKIF